MSPYHFCPLLCPSLHEVFPWQIQILSHTLRGHNSWHSLPLLQPQPPGTPDHTKPSWLCGLVCRVLLCCLESPSPDTLRLSSDLHTISGSLEMDRPGCCFITRHLTPSPRFLNSSFSASVCILFLNPFIFGCAGSLLLLRAQGSSPVAGHRLLAAVTSLVWSPGSWGSGLQEWRLPGSVVVSHGLSCSWALGPSRVRDGSRVLSLAGTAFTSEPLGEPCYSLFLTST